MKEVYLLELQVPDYRPWDGWAAFRYSIENHGNSTHLILGLHGTTKLGSSYMWGLLYGYVTSRKVGYFSN